LRVAASSRSAPDALREVARAAAALAISLLLLPVWRAAGAAEAYRRVIVGTAEKIVLATQHFPLLASFPDLKPPESDFVVLLVVALTLVSIGIGWRRRVGLLVLALALTAALQTLAAVATINLESAQEMERTRRILVLLPVEFRAVNQAKLILYVAQLVVIFTLFLLTSPWRGVLDTKASVSPRRLAVAVAVALVVLPGSWLAWSRWRETDARHVAAHAKVGHLFWVKRDDAIAEEQYRIALAGGTTDPEVYFNLAGIEAARGRGNEAARLLRRCAEVGADPIWAARVTRAFDRIGASR
jgi:hypothetical protein